MVFNILLYRNHTKNKLSGKVAYLPGSNQHSTDIQHSLFYLAIHNKGIRCENKGNHHHYTFKTTLLANFTTAINALPF